jgi:hypothetical protein
MRHRYRLAALIALLAGPSLASAALIENLDRPELRTGYVANFYFHELLSYDAGADRLSYSVSGPFDFSNRLSCTAPCVPSHLVFDGSLSWNAGVNEDGAVTDPGTMSWLGDLGSGSELLATGELLKVGAASVAPSPEPGVTSFGNLQFLLDFDFLDTRLSGMGDQMLLLFEQQFRTAFATPFHESFECGAGHESHFPTLPRCAYFSTSGAVGQVAEPATFALFSLGLAGLVFVVRKRSARSRAAA